MRAEPFFTPDTVSFLRCFMSHNVKKGGVGMRNEKTDALVC